MSKLVSIERARRGNVDVVLDEAKEMGFATVIVFGYREGQVVIKSSGHDDVLKLMGALEAAKQQLWAEA